jgi:hypothetical protein
MRSINEETDLDWENMMNAFYLNIILILKLIVIDD